MYWISLNDLASPGRADRSQGRERPAEERIASRAGPPGSWCRNLRAIASASGDAERSLQRIAEITEQLFGASSVSLLIADGERWGRTISVGAGSERIAAAIPLTHVPITPEFMPGAVYLENRQVHVPDVDDPAAMAGGRGWLRRGRPAPAPFPARRSGGRDGHWRAHRASRPPRALHGGRARAAAKLCRPGCDRDRERAAVQRDQGGAGAADGHRRHPADHRQFAVGRAAGVRRGRRTRHEPAGLLERARDTFRRRNTCISAPHAARCPIPSSSSGSVTPCGPTGASLLGRSLLERTVVRQPGCPGRSGPATA